MVRVSNKEAIFDGISTNKDIVDAFPIENENNREEEVSEVTMMEIDNLRNECMRVMENNLNRMLLQKHKEFNKGFSQKRRVLCGNFPSHF